MGPSLLGVQLEKQILHYSGVFREFIVAAVTVLQGSQSTSSVLKTEAKKALKSLRFICAPVCEATILIKEQTHVISGLPFAVNVF